MVDDTSPDSQPAENTTPDQGGEEAPAPSGDPEASLRFCRAVCDNCGWQGPKRADTDQAERDGYSHVDDHPQCDGKWRLVDW